MTKAAAIQDQFSIFADLNIGEKLQTTGKGKILGRCSTNGFLRSICLEFSQKFYLIDPEDERKALDRLLDKTFKLLNKKPSFYERLRTNNSRFFDITQLFLEVQRGLQCGLPIFFKTHLIEEQKNRRLREDSNFHQTVKHFVTKFSALELLFTNIIEQEKSLTASLPALNSCSESKDDLLNLFFLSIVFPKTFSDIRLFYIEDEFKLAQNTVINYLCTAYNDCIVNDILRFYRLETKEQFSLDDVHALVIGITANLTLKDLQTITEAPLSPLLVELKKGVFSEKNEHIDSLSEQEWATVLRELSGIDIVHLWLEQDPLYERQLSADIALIAARHMVESYNFLTPLNGQESVVHEMKKFGYTEILSREYAYALGYDATALRRKDILIPLYDERGLLRLKKSNLIFGKEGLYCFGVTPAIPEKNSNCVSIQVLFRGSWDLDSWNRNLHFGEKRLCLQFEGPGGKSFAANQLQIIEGILRNLPQKENHQRYVIDFMGHSLGATDAARCLAAVGSVFTKNESLQFKTFNYFGYNTPGFENDISNQFITDVMRLHQIQFNIRLFKTQGDGIQRVGSAFIGHSTEERFPANMNASVFQFGLNQKKRSSKNLAEYFSNKKKHLLNCHTHHYFSTPVEKSLSPFCDYLITSNLDDSNFVIGAKNKQFVAGLSPTFLVNQALTSNFI